MSDQIPTYVALADRLADDLASMAAGTKLASEHELAAREGVSRDTARAALQELERRYLVRRLHGAGTFVAPGIDFLIGPDSPASWSETVRRAGATPRQEVLDLTQLDDPDPYVREKLELSSGEPVLRVTTRGFVDDVAATITTAYLPTALAPLIEEQLALGGSHYSLLVALGYQPERDWLAAELDIVDHQTARLLELVGRPPAWHTESRLSDATSGRPLRYANGRSRPDVIRLRIAINERPSRES
ncbi:GntR family transcriptional regulator [Streptomyces sp. NPDC001508]|uniref:GntR family transcriptional regulator n=1 Tax=Streptomyces sp. NPDC001508 TaxID=3154656 RepID=UPI0033169602